MVFPQLTPVISSQFSRCTQLLGIALLITACGGGGGEETDPVVTVQTPACTGLAKALAADECTDSSTEPSDDDTPQFNDEITELAVENLIHDSVSIGEIRRYKVPADAEVILTSLNGNADLYLYNAADYNDETLVCYSREPHREDNCTGTSDSGTLHAIVYGRESSSFTLTATTDCSVESINHWVYRNMRDYYLFADQVPTVNPSGYDSTTELLRELRFDARDPYSGISDAGRQEAFFEEGKAFGFGYGWDWDADGNPRIIYTYDNSPMGQAGVNRGDIINKINGIHWSDLDADTYNAMIRDDNGPLTTSWELIDGVTGQAKVVSLTLAEYTTNTVMYVNAFTNANYSGKIGYLVFDQFLRTSELELDLAIQSLRDTGVTDLILDLRYNPGGYTSIARRLASQIAGPSLDGKTITRYQHNSKYTDENFERQFEAAEPTLELSRVAILTTPRTASSSELVINSLKPYINVLTFGTKTEGKAFISSSKRFCGMSLNAMEARGVNASGVSVEGGITPDCYAADDVTRDFGSRSGEIEGMLMSALDYFLYGNCTTEILTKQSNQSGFARTDFNDFPSAGAIDDNQPQ